MCQIKFFLRKPQRITHFIEKLISENLILGFSNQIYFRNSSSNFNLKFTAKPPSKSFPDSILELIKWVPGSFLWIFNQHLEIQRERNQLNFPRLPTLNLISSFQPSQNPTQDLVSRNQALQNLNKRPQFLQKQKILLEQYSFSGKPYTDFSNKKST